MTPVLKTTGLGLGYSGKMLLSGIEFELFSGQFMAVVGPNGCGKTTLVKAVLNTLAPLEGSICIHGRNLGEFSPRELAQTAAAVRQSVDPAVMTVKEYVLLGRLPFFSPYQFFETQKDLDLADRYMALAGIARLSSARITEISGGERQLAAIARALVQTPSLLVLDEPTSHLDITHQVRILDLLSRLKTQKKLAILMVLHDLNLAAEYADRLLLLDKQKGRMAGLGPPGEVLTTAAVQKAYQTRVRVLPNPITQNPWIFPVNPSHGETA